MTDDILPCRADTEDSASLFHELRRRVSATPGGRQAALALDTLGEFMTSKPRQNVPILTWSSLEPLIVPLGDLAHSYKGKCWCELIFALLDLVPVPARKPALVLQLALYAPREVRPMLLAEYWHLLLIGAHHHRLFTLSVALDVWGQALSTPVSCLAETLTAAARRIPAGSPWIIPASDPPERAPESVLTALASIPGEFDFVRGWCLVHLSPWLTRAGLGGEMLSLAEGLTHRFGSRGDTLQRLAAEPTGLTGNHENTHPRVCPGRLEEKRSQSLGESTVRRLFVRCTGGASDKEVPVYLGRPARGYHPLHFQNAWIQAQYGMAIPPDTLAEFQAL